MKFIRGKNRAQVEIISHSLDDTINPDAEVRLQEGVCSASNSLLIELFQENWDGVSTESTLPRHRWWIPLAEP